MPLEFHVCEPRQQTHWREYFDLRWRVLRAPWGQERGSEKDSFDPVALHPVLDTGPPVSVLHQIALTTTNNVIGVGRIHLLNPTTAQIRFMAVEPAYRCQGVASAILERLEQFARQHTCTSIILNARDTVQAFYLHKGYRITGHGELLFNQIAHVKMCKELPDN